jgi:osmotically-inducible protein OsmY
MVRLPLVVVVLLAVSLACGSGDVPRKQPADREGDAAPKEHIHKTAFPAVVPENEADRDIRRTLNLAIAEDAVLKDRQISFIVSNGDVSVSGIVKNEDERKKINELALNIDGVKSVANALRVAE